MISRIANRHRYRSCFYQRQCQKKYKAIIGDKDNYFKVKMPNKINIYSNSWRVLVLKAVRKMHKFSSKKRNICIDFTSTEKIHVSGMLYVFSEICNLLNINPNLKLKCIESRTKKVNHVLEQIGVFKVCNHNFLPSKEYNDVIYWRYIYGVGVLGEKFDRIVSPYQVLNEIPMDIDIYGACVEATKNAHVHAYIEKRQLSPVANQKTSWWMFSQIKDNILTVAICDLGIGIPKTLPKANKPLYKAILTFFKAKNDADFIWGAIVAPSSRTHKAFRGNGLKKIATIAHDDARASLEIYSSRGYIEIYRKRHRLCNYKSELPGTIVLWDIPLGDKNA